MTDEVKWHYVKDGLPPEPKEENGYIMPLTYICAYSLNNEWGDFEIADFLYLGEGTFNGENEQYPIYAWMEPAVNIPKPLNNKEETK